MSLRWQSLSTQVLAVTWVVAAGTAVAACQSAPPLLSPTPLGNPEASASLSEERCVNVAADGIALLGGVVLPNGTVGFGGMWVPVVLGGVSGEMASVVVGEDASGQHGAVHLTLEHAFRAANGDYFITQDRAVCAPAGTNPATCRVNDVLDISTGTGMFANANGSLRNHGTVDFAQGTLAFSMRGRMCGDGL